MTKLMEQVVADLEKLPEERQVQLATDLLQKIQQDLKELEERKIWTNAALQRLAGAYSDDEPEYTDADIIRK